MTIIVITVELGIVILEYFACVVIRLDMYLYTLDPWSIQRAYPGSYLSNLALSLVGLCGLP